jgi:hypothetical protein
MKYIRSLLSISVIIAFATPLHSQTVTPFTSLPNATSVGGNDILPVVTDPSGDTVAKKVTITVVHDLLAAQTKTYTGKTLDGDDNNFSDIPQSAITNLATDLAAKAPINNPTFTGTVGGITKSMVGLGNVENTALSTWTGSTNVNTVGTIGTGTWNATPVDGTKIEVQQSLVNDSSGIKLSGDSSSPGNNKVYGTNGSGTKGWYDAASGGSAIDLPLEAWVTTNGNNTTGTVGDPSKPYATITEALADLKTANGGTFTRGTIHIGPGVTNANATATGLTGDHTLVLLGGTPNSDSNYRPVSLSFAQSAQNVRISGSSNIWLSTAVGGGNTVSLVSPPRNYTLRLNGLTMGTVSISGEDFSAPPPNAVSGNGTDGQQGSGITFEAVDCGIMGDITLRGGAGQPGGTTDDTDQNGGNGGSGGFMSIRFVSCYSTEVNAVDTHTIEMQAGGSGAGGSGNGAGTPGSDGDSNNMDAKFHNVHAPNVSLWDSTDSFSVSATVEIIDGCYEYLTFDTLGAMTIYGTGYSGLGGAVTAGNGSYDWTP